MRRRRLLWQVFPAYVLLTVALLLLLLLESRGRLRDFYLHQTASNLAASAAMFAEAAKVPLEAHQYAEVETLAKQVGKASGLRITLILPGGKVVAESREDPALMESHRTRPEIARALDTRVMEYDVRHSDTLDQDFLYVALPLLRDGEPWLVVRVSTPATAVDEALRTFERRIIYGSLLAAAAIVAISWFIARRISRPLEAITHGVKRFGGGELDYRLPVGGSREIAALAETLNSMAAQLHEQIETNTVQRKEQEAVLFSMEEGVLTLDNQGNILNLNRAADQMFQLDPTKVRGRPIHEVLRKADVLAFVEKALSSALPLQEDIMIYDKERHFLTAYGNVLRDTRDERIGVLVVFRDVTQLRRLENVRRDFVANASHELRTPVTSIKGFVETLLEGGLEDRENAHRFLRIILDQANRLGAIINDILSLARVEKDSADQSVVLQHGSIREVLDAAVAMCGRQAGEKSIRLAVDCDAELTADINPGLLEQAVTNLIDNAVKYSQSGAAVEVSAGRESGDVVIQVIDHGCGIELRHLSRLFERFYRADPGRSRQLGGTGLGLAIANHIVMAHGGSISVRSKPGEGSTFIIRLPEGKTQSEAAT
jgi:two-component system, OmpR family, phosphate regulon sensor histidine kinase PhoR